MARFAAKCREMLPVITHELVVTLGPETRDLSMRIGLHSGSVTAGVLRGERSRFQLFGDSVNTASRMESTSKPGFIQLSKSTADLLTAAGKGDWYEARQEKVSVKGKGEMQTYFLSKQTTAMSVATTLNSGKDTETPIDSNDEEETQPDQASRLYV